MINNGWKSIVGVENYEGFLLQYFYAFLKLLDTVYFSYKLGQ